MTNANDHYGSDNGTGSYYSCKPFPITYTDGVKDLVENCNAYWLIDVILSHQTRKMVNSQSFQVWNLNRLSGDSFRIQVTDGNDNEIATQIIPFSDFPFDLATIWLVRGTLLLPKEY